MRGKDLFETLPDRSEGAGNPNSGELEVHIDALLFILCALLARHDRLIGLRLDGIIHCLNLPPA